MSILQQHVNIITLVQINMMKESCTGGMNAHFSDREKSSLLLSLWRTKKLPSCCWVNNSSASRRPRAPWYHLHTVATCQYNTVN